MYYKKRPSFLWVWSLALTAVYEDMIALDIVITKAVDLKVQNILWGLQSLWIFAALDSLIRQ